MNHGGQGFRVNNNPCPQAAPSGSSSHDVVYAHLVVCTQRICTWKFGAYFQIYIILLTTCKPKMWPHHFDKTKIVSRLIG